MGSEIDYFEDDTQYTINFLLEGSSWFYLLPGNFHYKLYKKNSVILEN